MIKRRQILKLGTGMLAVKSLGVSATTSSGAINNDALKPIRRGIPSSGELLPAIGMGTSVTFDSPDDAATMANLTEIMNAFFAGKGTVIDTSPMYGQAEARVGDILREMPQRPNLFAATKVWTTGKEGGIAQMQVSAKRMNVDSFDLIAVHNLQDWQTHLETLKQWKLEGRVRYIGITTSHGRNQEKVLEVMRTQPLDFVQFTYNIEDRSAENSILPLAQDRGIATMINRPYQRGSLFARSGTSPLPEIAKELGCDSWGQFYLKFILGHPAVTSIIPATSKLKHMVDNMKANFGDIPDQHQRAEMLRVFDKL